MSRPQYQQQSVPHVVNGGLIDFQDNISRGMPEYGMGYSAGGMYAVPGMPGPATLAGFQGASVPQLGCVSGPPTFLQVNGVVYKPVDDCAAGADAKMAKVEAKEEPSKGMSEREMERAIDERVQSRVSQFLSTQRHRGGRDPFEPDRERRSEAYEPDRERRAPEPYEAGRGGEREAEMSRAVEEEVAKRIKRINASMRAPARG